MRTLNASWVEKKHREARIHQIQKNAFALFTALHALLMRCTSSKLFYKNHILQTEITGGGGGGKFEITTPLKRICFLVTRSGSQPQWGFFYSNFQSTLAVSEPTNRIYMIYKLSYGFGLLCSF